MRQEGHFGTITSQRFRLSGMTRFNFNTIGRFTSHAHVPGIRQSIINVFTWLDLDLLPDGNRVTDVSLHEFLVLSSEDVVIIRDACCSEIIVLMLSGCQSHTVQNFLLVLQIIINRQIQEIIHDGYTSLFVWM